MNTQITNFTIESVEVVRKFLERNPMYEAELKQLYAEGRIHTLFTGNNIVDSNLSSGESIIRNFLYGKRWMKQHMNQESGICMRTDALAIRHSFRRLCADFGCAISEESATAPVMETTGAAWTVRQLHRKAVPTCVWKAAAIINTGLAPSAKVTAARRADIVGSTRCTSKGRSSR